METKEKANTTIKLQKATMLALQKLKIHPRQSYDEIIKQIIERAK